MFGVLKLHRRWNTRVRGATGLSLLCSGAIWLAGCSTIPGPQLPGEIAREANAQHVEPTRFSLTEIDASVVASRARSSAQRDTQVAAELTGQSSQSPPSFAYRIGPADVLQVTVWDHPELAQGQGAQPSTGPRPADPPQGTVVDDEGFIQFPYVGRLKVSGLSTAEIQTRLRAALAEYFREPQVTVRVASFRAKQVLIDGEVHAPGVQQINDVPMTLMDAISRAGGFTANADQGRLQLIRDDRHFVVDIAGLVAQGESPTKLMLRNGDMLRVASRDESGAYVMGEVARPLTAIPKADGRLTLADALSQAGSFNLSSSDPRQLYVIRGTQGGAQEVFHLDARSPTAMVMAGRFRLEPDDVVYVAPTDLAVVYRVLSQLLPAIGAGLTGAVVAK